MNVSEFRGGPSLGFPCRVILPLLLRRRPQTAVACLIVRRGVGTVQEELANTRGFLLFFSQEEYEDSSGNVVNKKTYEDLKRQGLL